MQDFYQTLCHLPGFVLLESTDTERGRYDILSAYPYDGLKIHASDSDFEQKLKTLEEKLVYKPAVNDLPFQGGAIGYVAYDLGAKQVGIHTMAQPTLSDMPLVDLGFYDWAIISDHFLKKTTLFAANTQAETAEVIKEVLNLWHTKEPAYSQKAQLKSDFKPVITEAEYENSFYNILQELQRGRSYQVNLTQPFHAKFSGYSWDFYRRITAKNPVPFSAFLRNEDAEVLSFSPERFLYYDQGKLITSPIKGTTKRGKSVEEDELLKQKLLACEKNRAENVMIVDLLRNDLGKIATAGSVQVTSLCEVESYHSVHHLVSTIEAQCLPELHPFRAFLSCFPGGSITGAPKIEAMRIIDEEERYSRGIYCGSIGYFSWHGRFDTNIAIRTLIAKNDILHLAAGGGLVMDSQCKDEYQECFIKIAAVLHGLQ